MKYRAGFVSNSSTSSFVLGKNYMTNKQISKFREFLMEDDKYFIDCGEGYIGETDYYFQGESSMHWDDKLMKFLKEIGVDLKYVGDY